MNKKAKRALSRAGSIAVMLAAALTVVAFSWRHDMMALATGVRPMENKYSDNELIVHVDKSHASGGAVDVILAADKKYDVGRDFIDFVTTDKQINPDGRLMSSIERYISANGYRHEMWQTLTGLTFSVLYDIYTGAAGSAVPVLGDGVYSQRSTTIAFTGDVNLSYDWYNMQRYRELGVEGCFSDDALSLLRGAALTFVNNEFPISRRGEALEGKMYTFRADPDDLSIYSALGVDMVSLANNHVYDYGPAAFADTLTHLDDAGIMRVGAGMNEEEASRPVYIISGGMKFAFVSASSAEVTRFTPVASGDAAGVCGLYDSDAFLRVIEDAAAHSDFVVAYVHFGTENSPDTDPDQVADAHAMIDAGADIVVGSHPHVLQPIEYYDGKPIVYSLGNFWFNTKTVDTGILTVTTSVGIRPVLRFYPCVQSGGRVALADADDAARITESLNSRSSTASIGEDGRVREVY